MNIQRGMRDKLDKYLDTRQELSVLMRIQGKATYDFCCFGVDAANKLSDERYMVFYNQPRSPEGEITFQQNGAESEFRCGLSRLPQAVNKLVFTASIDGAGVMGDIGAHTLVIRQKGKDVVTLALSGADFQKERAIITMEIYKKDGVWRFAAVAAGFNGGLGDLLRSYGGEEAAPAQPAAPPPPQKPAKVSLEKKLQQAAPQLVSLAKPITLELKKHNLLDCIARVALVMDISGSMSWQYQNGTVQEIVNKIVPLAVQFDDDGKLDFWYYGSTYKRRRAVTTGNYQRAVPANWGRLMKELGYGNNEPAVMREVLNAYQSTKLPVYVVFITDGGVGSEREIKQLMITASRLPIFWQFVGVGGSGFFGRLLGTYGVLERLDSMEGRYVDNANFFALDDFRTVDNATLYSRLLNEFPKWLQAVRQKGML